MKVEYLKGTNVVAIAPIRARMNFPAISKVEAYWEGLRNGRVMPARAEVDPRGIADVLEFAFILEKIAPGLARVRLAGMHLNDLMSMEVRGMPITAMFLPEARREMQRVLEGVMENPAVVRLTLASDAGYSRAPLEAQMILMPLRDDEGRATRVLGALQAKGEIGRGPRRFVIRDIETKPLLDDAPRATPRTTGYEAPATRQPALAGFGEPAQAEFKRRERPAPVAESTDKPGFAPRTMELARQIAALNKERAESTGSDVAEATLSRSTRDETAPRKGNHLRLVFNADE